MMMIEFNINELVMVRVTVIMIRVPASPGRYYLSAAAEVTVAPGAVDREPW